MLQDLTETDYIVLFGDGHIEEISVGDGADARLPGMSHDARINVDSPILDAKAVICSRHSTRTATDFKDAEVCAVKASTIMHITPFSKTLVLDPLLWRPIQQARCVLRVCGQRIRSRRKRIKIGQGAAEG